MRVLHGVVASGPGLRARRLMVAGAVIAAVAVLSGCAQFDAALGQREAVVSFRDGTSMAQKLVVRSTCAKVPAVTEQPLPPDLKTPYALPQLTYRIDKASDADVAKLEECLNKFTPMVTGIVLQDASDEGN